MLVSATERQYEEVFFNPSIVMIERVSWSKKERIVKLVSAGRTIAKRVTGRLGNFYFVETN